MRRPDPVVYGRVMESLRSEAERDPSGSVTTSSVSGALGISLDDATIALEHALDKRLLRRVNQNVCDLCGSVALNSGDSGGASDFCSDCNSITPQTRYVIYRFTERLRRESRRPKDPRRRAPLVRV